VTTNANLTNEATSSGSNAVTLTNSAVIGKVLTGYTSGAGTVAATDTILQAIEKLNGNAAGGSPTGAIIGFGSATPPTGWLACNGANVSRATYSALFAVISTTFGAGDGSTTFTLPVSARRTMVGSGGTGTATLGNAVGNSGGEESHVQTIAEIASHNHALGGAGVSSGSSPSFNRNAIAYFGTTNTGSGTAFNVIQPSLIITYIIKT
jgi:microcystin-dependent protein